MQEIRYGLIGCGRISATHINAIEQMHGATITAISDINAERAAQVSENCASKPTIYTDYNELVADENIDIAVILVPSHMHAEATVAAANAGKHIYCEKIMAPTLAECRDMIRAADENGVQLTVGHNTRYSPAFSQARRLIEAGEIGDIISIDGIFAVGPFTRDLTRPTFWGIKAGARGHGYVMNFGCHYMDTARFLLNEDAKSVSAYITNRYSQGYAPEDQFTITAVTPSDRIVNIALYAQLKPSSIRNNGFVIFGSEGVIEAYYRPDRVYIHRHNDDDYSQIQIDDDLAVNTQLRLHRELRAAICGQNNVKVTGVDGYHAVEFALASYLAHERRAWIDLPLGPEHYEYGGPIMHESLSIAEP